MCRNPIQCIIPPNILDSIARKGTAAQREWALETLALDHSLRAARAAAVGVTRSGRSESATPGKPNRTIHDAANTESYNGKVVRSEGAAPVADVAVNEAYDGLGATFKLWWDIYDRDSIDDGGLPLVAHVHYGAKYDNAFWDGQRMVFGDGDGKLFNRFTISIDVIGHELTHGVTQDEAGLNYLNQSGALNESLSDVFGSLVKQYALGQTAKQADWLIGAGLLAPGVKGVALRSMKAPGTAYDDPLLGKDPQPKHMKDYVVTSRDNGGVHINSGIPNFAFYKLAIALGGKAWEKAGHIWYDAMRDPAVRPSCRFRTFAAATVRAANRRYGAGSTEAAATLDSWRSAGVQP